jgi:23S rRNA (uracil1939-C5)-methyltransferase
MNIQKNDEIKLHITAWAEKGLAYGFVDDVPVLVPNTMPGDVISAVVTKCTPRKAYAKCLSVDTPSSNRRESPCEISIRCGGCQLWHAKYVEQLAYKKLTVEQAFEDKGVSLPALSVVGMDSPEFYRNRAQYSVSRDSEGFMFVGLTAARSQTVIDTSVCRIQHDLSNQALSIFRKWLTEYDVPVFNTNGQEAGVAHFVTRVGVGTGQLMVAISSSKKELPFLDELVEALQVIKGLTSVHLDLNTNPQWQALGGISRVLWGKETITEEIDGLKFELSLSSFFQANSLQIKQLWDAVSTLGEFQSSDSVLDLYCGTGSIALHLARSVKTVVGVETHEDAVKNAVKNAESNGISNCSFVEKDVADYCLEFEGAVDAVVLDPPRKGLDRMVIESLAERQVSNIVYVSCNPESLVRDVCFFENRGYKVSKATVVDMFPQTYHIETVVVLTK